MSQTLSDELRGVIEKHVRAASASQLFAITSALCATPEEIQLENVDFQTNTIPRFQVLADTVYDRRTNLTWARRTMPWGRLTWAKAKEACESSKLASYTDWRLPTIRELLSIVDYGKHNPAIDLDFFDCESAWYWTSTPVASSPGDRAWVVNFYCGSSSWNSQDHRYGFVRAVRSL
jgi:hypothetical protein